MSLRITRRNIWDLYDEGRTIVVTTNIGWDSNDMNNMGAGTALDAWRRFSWLPRHYGRYCREHGASAPVLQLPHIRLVLFPVKPLVEADPEFSWDQLASPELIERSARQLAELRVDSGPIALTLPGCGNGALDPAVVRPILVRALPSEHFEVCDWRHSHPVGEVSADQPFSN